MQIRYHCPTDKCVAIIEYEPLEENNGSMTCPRCHKTHIMHIDDALRHSGHVGRCAVCNGTELFVRKDFPQALGVMIVVTFGLAAIYYFTVSVLIAWTILVAAILLDVAIYAVIGRVTACYACRAEYRRCNLNPAHEGFDLATSEKY